MKALFALLFSASLASAQMPMGGVTVSYSGVTLPTFANYTYALETGATATASISSAGALSVATGDYVVGACATGASATTADVLSDSLGNTYTMQTIRCNSSNCIETGYTFSTAAGSDTFTCTPATSQPHQTMVVLHYASSSGTYLTSVGTTQSSGAAFTSPVFSTASSALVVECANWYGGSPAFSVTAGTVGGSAATLRGVSNTSLTAVATLACEEYVSSGPLSGVTATIVYGYSGEPSVGTVVAVN